MRPQGGWPDRKGGRRRRGKKPGSVRSQSAVCKETVMREGDPPKQLCALNACGHQGGERGGGPPTQKRMPMARSKGPGGGTPKTAAWAPTARPGVGGGTPPRPSSARNLHVGRRGGGDLDQAVRILHV